MESNYFYHLFHLRSNSRTKRINPWIPQNNCQQLRKWRKFYQLFKVTVSLYTLFIRPLPSHSILSSKLLFQSELNRKVLKSFLTLRRFFAVYKWALQPNVNGTTFQVSVEEFKVKIWYFLRNIVFIFGQFVHAFPIKLIKMS